MKFQKVSRQSRDFLGVAVTNLEPQTRGYYGGMVGLLRGNEGEAFRGLGNLDMPRF